MNWLATGVYGASSVFLIVAGLFFFLYAREFYIRGVPAEWGLIGAGLIVFGAGSGLTALIDTIIVPAVQLLGGVVVFAGFALAYWRSTGGFL